MRQQAGSSQQLVIVLRMRYRLCWLARRVFVLFEDVQIEEIHDLTTHRNTQTSAHTHARAFKYGGEWLNCVWKSGARNS